MFPLFPQPDYYVDNHVYYHVYYYVLSGEQ